MNIYYAILVCRHSTTSLPLPLRVDSIMAPNLSATHRVLELPELLSTILGFLHREGLESGVRAAFRRLHLFPCALVNKQWYRETIWHLWKDLSQWDEPVDHFFGPITPSRRQFYADLVRKATLHFCPTYRTDHPWLEGLAFPLLEKLYYLIDLPNDADVRVDLPPPNINAPRLKKVKIKYCVGECAEERWLLLGHWCHLDHIKKEQDALLLDYES